MVELAGRTALVTGGAVRLGRAISLELARAGANVAIHCHTNFAAGQDVQNQILAMGRRAAVVTADLSSGADIARLFREVDTALGAPDILVSNAGIFERAPFESIDEPALRRMIDINLLAPFLCAQEATRRMRKIGQGDIVHVLDVGGTSAAWKGYAHYCSAKAGLAMLTRVLAAELAPDIRVNAVAPGAVLFPDYEDEATRTRVLSRVPMGREGSPEDVAQTVRFLVCGPRYVTGQIIAVDGGRSAAG